MGDDVALDESVEDEELAAMALAADPDAVVDDDAVPLRLLGGGAPAPLPGWYMPPPAFGTRLLRGWRRRLVFVIVAAFVLINMYGLCSTYGWVELA
ncbi:MAG TPA: hypothetical protein VHM89_07545 [Acidimicrobiales bacterium]|nr:hypothetical protein [Acidimicrobiales bacterium]